MGKIDIGFLTVIVGETGTGKSCIAKKMFKNAPSGCVLDVQEEYEVTPLNELNAYAPKFSLHPANYDMEEIVRIPELSKGFTFLYEESTGVIDSDFFRSKLGKRLVKSIVAKRHSQREVGGGNNFILIFHSTKSIPAQLWTFIDFMFIFPLSERDSIDDGKITSAMSSIDLNKRIPWESWEISDYRLVLRTNLAKDNTWYVEDYLSKLSE